MYCSKHIAHDEHWVRAEAWCLAQLVGCIKSLKIRAVLYLVDIQARTGRELLSWEAWG